MYIVCYHQGNALKNTRLCKKLHAAEFGMTYSVKGIQCQSDFRMSKRQQDLPTDSDTKLFCRYPPPLCMYDRIFKLLKCVVCSSKSKIFYKPTV